MAHGVLFRTAEGRNDMWQKNARGWRFLPGRDAPDAAASAARQCRFFRMDDEEECFAEEDVSCYNCQYRRWSPDSFDCMNQEVWHG